MEAAALVPLRAACVHRRSSGLHPSITSYSLRYPCSASTVPARGLICNSGSQMGPIDDAYTKFSEMDRWGVQKDNELRPFCRNYDFIFYQVLVEVKWFLKLSEIPEVKEVPTFSKETRAFLESIIQKFNKNEAFEVQKIMKITNHDVKAVVHYLKLKCKNQQEVSKVLEYFHFACTSEDIHNLAYALLVKNSMNHVMFPVMTDLCKALCAMAKDNAHIPMPSHTHYQMVSPTTLGKEMAIFAFRLGYCFKRMTEIRNFGKFTGVVGNYNAQKKMYPETDWTRIAQEFVTSLGLQFNPYASQIGYHHYMVELFDNILNFNNVLIDFRDDVCSYISLGYFKQITKEGEIWPSTMPHKVYLTDFGNSYSYLLLAKAGLTFVRNVSSSRSMIYMTDILGFIWLGLKYSLLAYKKYLQGIKMLQVNESRLAEDLEKNWEVFAKAIKTVMKTYVVPELYDMLEELTRGDVDKESISSFIQNLNLPEEEKLKLLNLIPYSYIGEAENLARSIDEALGSLLGFEIK